MVSADPNARPRPAPPIQEQHLNVPTASRSVFGERWMVLEFAGGDRPDLRAAAIIGRAMRNALMSAWGADVPSWLSGHERDGTPTREPHIAIVPLANVGYRWSDGTWNGLAIVLPRSLEETWLGAATPQAFANRQKLLGLIDLLSSSSCESEAVSLQLGVLGQFQLRLVDAPDRQRLQSLQPSQYLRQSNRW
jgi:CRISPR-associated protein Csb2